MPDKVYDSKETFDQSIVQLLKKGNTVALTGAGISEESGIPTFRGENGLWAKYDPEIYADPAGLLSLFKKDSRKIAVFLEDLYATLFKASPNPGHLALAGLEKNKILNGVITQNIDNLHQDAGSKNVWELHGNAFRIRCADCGKKKILKREELSRLIEDLKISRSRQKMLKVFSRLFPRCICKGRFRIDIVLFTELLPPGILEEAYRQIEKSSLLMLIGTSGAVYPAASLPIFAKERGVKILEINSATSNLSIISDYQIIGKAGEILPHLVKALQ